MHERRIRSVLPTAGLAVVCAALGAAWVAEPSFAPEGWQGRLVVLLCAMLLALVVHGGHIEVASEVGLGSTFRIVLPAMMQIKA